jgi:hypothetical protein
MIGQEQPAADTPFLFPDPPRTRVLLPLPRAFPPLSSSHPQTKPIHTGWPIVLFYHFISFTSANHPPFHMIIRVYFVLNSRFSDYLEFHSFHQTHPTCNKNIIFKNVLKKVQFLKLKRSQIIYWSFSHPLHITKSCTDHNQN